MISFEQAIMELQRQSMERGLGGLLSGPEVNLCEDGQTVSLWAFYHLDPPLIYSFDLPAPVREFDPSPYLARMHEENERIELSSKRDGGMQ